MIKFVLTIFTRYVVECFLFVLENSRYGNKILIKTFFKSKY